MLQPTALTSGDPAGIGIELALQAWQELRHEMAFFLLADRRHLKSYLDGIPICEISEPHLATAAMPQGLPLLHLDFPCRVSPGQSAPENAPAIIRSIELAAQFAKDGRAASVCTNPINKRILRQAGGFTFPGQTEFLARFCQSDSAVMMLSSSAVRVVPVTIHMPLKLVPDALTIDTIVHTAKVTDHALRHDFAVQSPRIFVSGLNPHAGEEGEFGEEDKKIITPAILRLAESGMRISGPHPADSMFHEEIRKSYDVALCMYHDQALIPLKTLDFFGAVNVTLGLPIVRTSPDHGTGFSIAGQGIACAESLIKALRMGQEIARRRNPDY